MDFDMLLGATGSHMALLPGIRKMTSCGGGDWIHKFLRSTGFYQISTRKLPLV